MRHENNALQNTILSKKYPYVLALHELRFTFKIPHELKVPEQVL